ncbi:MAG: DUF2934 domain-containing protein [Methylobacter sp.]|nr:DUF2934 domain-containing protein [Methylobacter sp.]
MRNAITLIKDKAPAISHEEDRIYVPDREAMIAELAYYKAEQRGFESGHELDDWLDAEQEFNR